jgi:hypothetical protein
LRDEKRLISFPAGQFNNFHFYKEPTEVRKEFSFVEFAALSKESDSRSASERQGRRLCLSVHRTTNSQHLPAGSGKFLPILLAETKSRQSMLIKYCSSFFSPFPLCEKTVMPRTDQTQNVG